MEEYDIADIKQEIDCRNVAGQYLGPPLQRSGRASQWNCPFHEDYATPSFMSAEQAVEYRLIDKVIEHMEAVK